MQHFVFFLLIGHTLLPLHTLLPPGKAYLCQKYVKDVREGSAKLASLFRWAEKYQPIDPIQSLPTYPTSNEIGTI